MKNLIFIILTAFTAAAQTPREFVRSFDTANALQSSTLDPQHKTISLRGWTSVGDSNSGLFRYDATSSVATNTSDVLAQTYGAAQGRYIRIKGIFQTEASKLVTLSELSTLDFSVSPTAVYATDSGQEGVFQQVLTANLPTWAASGDVTGMAISEPGGTGKWVRQFQGAFNVKWFGAKGNGSTDDTAAIQEAVTTATINPSNIDYTDDTVVYLPYGEYVCDGSSIYAYGNRKPSRALVIRGDGKFATFVTTARTNATPVWLMDQMKFTMEDLSVSGNIYPASAPYDYRCYGLAMYNSDYYVIRDCSFLNLSKGIIANNTALNWGALENTDINECTVGIHGTSFQAAHVTGHMAYNGNTFFGAGTGVNFQVHTEGCGLVADMPANYVLLAGTGYNFTGGYGEGMLNGAFPIMAGVQLTNKVTMSAVGDQVTVTFTNAHHYPYFSSFTVNKLVAGSGGSDITSGILGARTWNAAPENTNAISQANLTFTAGNPITNSLAGDVFELVGPSTGIDVKNLIVSGGLLGSDAGPILLDHVNKASIRVHAVSAGNAVQYTTNSIDVRAEFPADGEVGWTDYKGDYKLQNVFPDPEFNGGTNWIVPTEWYTSCDRGWTDDGFSPGDRALRYTITNKNTYLYALHKADFYPTIPATDLNGHRVLLSYWVKAVDNDAYVPTTKTASWTIDAAGTGYSDGEATVTTGGRTVTVTLTTSGGAITDTVWYWNTFASDIGATSLAVTQAGGSGGMITPPTLTDCSLSTEGTLAGAFQVRLFPGGATSGGDTFVVNTFGTGSYIWDQNLAVSRFQADGWYHKAAICYVTGVTSKLRLWLYNSSANTTNAEGDEEWLVDKLTITIQDDVLRIDDAMRGHYQNAAYPSPMSRYRTANPYLGASWPYTEDGIAAVFAGDDGTTTTIKIKDESGNSGTAMKWMGSLAAAPSSPVNGDMYYDTVTLKVRIYSNGAWADLN